MGTDLNEGNAMERVCFSFELHEGAEAEYKKRHDEIWPELVEVIQEAGLKNYSLFRRGTLVIGYVEAYPDAATAFAKVGASEYNSKWSEWFKDLIVNQADDQGNMMRFTEVWHLE
jgi:L-rhamnose mutarotase